MEIKDFIQKLIVSLGFDQAEIDIEEKDDGLYCTIKLNETESGMLIGYHGEKIDALQLITNIVHNHEKENYQPIQIDIADYRKRRIQTLHELADRAVEKATESGREILLPPLPSYERRIIHTYLGENSQVSTYSEGEGRNRRLVVRPNMGE